MPKQTWEVEWIAQLTNAQTRKGSEVWESRKDNRKSFVIEKIT